jgi:hypothetical protein
MIPYIDIQIQDQSDLLATHKGHVSFVIDSLVAEQIGCNAAAVRRKQILNHTPDGSLAKPSIRAQTPHRSAIKKLSFFRHFLPREARNLIRPIRHQILNRGIVLSIHSRQLLKRPKHPIRSSPEHRLRKLHNHHQKISNLANGFPSRRRGQSCLL